MSCLSILQSTATWLPFVATDTTDDAPRTGITYLQVAVLYKKSTQSSFQVKALVTGDFREIGNGVYEILFSVAELNTLGSFIFIVNGNGVLPIPALNQYVGLAQVLSVTAYTPATVVLPTNVVTGNLLSATGAPLVGEAVSARIMAAPTVLGTYPAPGLGGVGTDIVAAVTDAAGFFALELLQGAVVDLVIPVINYRRTLTVPANSTDNLFDIP